MHRLCWWDLAGAKKGESACKALCESVLHTAGDLNWFCLGDEEPRRVAPVVKRLTEDDEGKCWAHVS